MPLAVSERDEGGEVVRGGRGDEGGGMREGRL